MTVRTGITRDMIGLVASNELDIALTTMPVEERGLTVTPWRTEKLVAGLQQTNDNPPRYATPAYIARRPLILDGRSQIDGMVRAWLRAGGFEPKIAMEIGNFDAIRNLVAIGLGVSILGPEVIGGTVVAGGVITLPLRPALTRQISIVQRKDKADDAVLGIVREALMMSAK